MKNILIILLGLYTFSANTGELKRESSGFSETEEFKFDQDNHEYTHKYIRETAVSGGVGKSNIISGTGKWKKHIGVTCTYAIDYLKTALFLIEKCNLKPS